MIFIFLYTLAKIHNSSNVDTYTNLSDTGCLEVVTTPGTVITSPGYPAKYPNNVDCSYVIRFNDNQRITLTFLKFSVYRPEYGPTFPR